MLTILAKDSEYVEIALSATLTEVSDSTYDISILRSISHEGVDKSTLDYSNGYRVSNYTCIKHSEAFYSLIRQTEEGRNVISRGQTDLQECQLDALVYFCNLNNYTIVSITNQK